MVHNMNYYIHMYDVVQNRVSMVNQIMGYPSDHAAPCELVDAKTCEDTFCGRTVCTWRRWDHDGVTRAVDVMSILSKVLWDARRIGFDGIVKNVTINQYMDLTLTQQ